MKQHPHFKQTKKRKRIKTLVLYGGSFDPIHLGHIQAIKVALKSLNPNDFFIIPAFRNPFKTQIKYTTHQRTKWLKRILKQNIKNTRVSLCLFEIKRNRPTPTITTIQYLKKIYSLSQIYFLLGADNIEHLHTWDEFETLNQLVEFVFLERKNYSIPSSYRLLPLNIPASSTQIRAGHQKKFLPHFLQGLR